VLLAGLRKVGSIKVFREINELYMLKRCKGTVAQKRFSDDFGVNARDFFDVKMKYRVPT